MACLYRKQLSPFWNMQCIESKEFPLLGRHRADCISAQRNQMKNAEAYLLPAVFIEDNPNQQAESQEPDAVYIILEFSPH